MKRYDRMTSLICLFMAGGICLLSSRFPVGSWKDPGPGFLPLGSGILLGILSIILHLQSRLGRAEEINESWFRKEQWVKLVLVLATLLGYAIALEPLGFLISTCLLLFILFILVQPQKVIVALGGSVFTTACSYALFELWLKMRLPRGPLGF
jgi:putative tricarboxylic transport membrane protein